MGKNRPDFLQNQSIVDFKRSTVMQECKACLAKAHTGKASLALPAYSKCGLLVRFNFNRAHLE